MNWSGGKINKPKIAVLFVLFLLLVLGATANSAINIIKPSYRINTGTPIAASSCIPCHGGLTRTKFETLNFSHEKHFKKGIRCESCHQEFPHKKTELISKPKMEWCFSCHGLSHGRQGLKATGKCSACHTADFNLTPKDHTIEWVQTNHKKINTENANCSMCHKSDFCNSCHTGKQIKTVKLSKFKPAAAQKTKGQTIDLAGDVTASKCLSCHGSLARQNYKTLNFKHEIHFKRNIACSKCHNEFPHYKEDEEKDIRPKTKIPEMRTCFSCHGLEHGNQGTFATGKCEACHPPDFKLKPDTHDEQWVREKPFNHKVNAKEDKGQCMMCHDQQKFCNKCHGIDPIPHEKNWKDLHGKTVAELADTSENTKFSDMSCNNCHNQQQFCAKCHKGVEFPHSVDWASQHGKTVVDKSREACYTCHGKQICSGCHRGVEMPHKQGWLGEHRKYFNDGRTANDCLGCHKKEQCEQCHSAHRVHDRNNIYKYNFPGLQR